jgi:lipopolysaccharide biosynthesis glycosyltransferase
MTRADSVRVFIGHDPREQPAYDVAVRSLARVSPQALVTPLRLDRLAAGGLLRRLTDTRGVIWDLPSNAPCSTEFAISRFLVPMLAQTGWALFTDCDVVFQADVAQLFALADPRFAVMVVKHPPLLAQGVKMDGQAQVAYGRKNWSSVMLWNCDHPANARLSLADVNERPGRDLHALYWLADSEIGELPARWNWLVNLRPRPEEAGIAHFTEGGPWLPTWRGAPHDDLWLEASR